LGQKKTGGRVEVFLIRKVKANIWQAMIGGRNLKSGDQIYFKHDFQVKLVKKVESKVWQIEFNKSGQESERLIEKIGQTPLPPYIKTQDSQQIRKDYQTIFAKNQGSIAAPTAGLHFTKRILQKLKAKNIQVYKITLHVGLGTFAPVDVEDITKYQIHSELVSIDSQTARELNQLKKQNLSTSLEASKKIIAVGTTTARALEAFTDKKGKLHSGNKWVDLYIYPGYKYRFVDDLITNFHLPKSSLLFMVAALAGRENILKAYQKAIKLKYRFYSFGDAMLITGCRDI